MLFKFELERIVQTEAKNTCTILCKLDFTCFVLKCVQMQSISRY